jgi:hypothetical protein
VSNSKKKADAAKRRSKRKEPSDKRQHERSATKATFVKLDLHGEIRRITEFAQSEDSRWVRIGNLALFSTGTGDAWLLNLEDRFAMCLCRDGEPQPFRIMETADTLAIEWTADFAIEGTAFVVQERSGRVVAIHGYPTAEILAACEDQ